MLRSIAIAPKLSRDRAWGPVQSPCDRPAAIASKLHRKNHSALFGAKLGVRHAAVIFPKGARVLHFSLETALPSSDALEVKLLEETGIVTELTGQKKNRSLSCRAEVELLAR